MAFPPGVAAKTVTIGTASFFDGTIAEGTVTVTAPVNVLHTPSNRPLFSSQMRKRFVDGEATFDLVPTDHPDLNRRNFSYKMVVTIQGALVQPDPINFLLPVAGPDIVDLDGLVTVPSSAGTPISVDVLTTSDLPPLVDDGGPFSDALREASVAVAKEVAPRVLGANPIRRVTLFDGLGGNEEYLGNHATITDDPVFHDFGVGKRVKNTSSDPELWVTLTEPVRFPPEASVLGMKVYVHGGPPGEPVPTDVLTALRLRLHPDDAFAPAKLWSRATDAQPGQHEVRYGWNTLRFRTAASTRDAADWGRVKRMIAGALSTDTSLEFTVAQIWAEVPEKASVVVIEDGGYVNFLNTGWPIMRDRGIPVTWAVDPYLFGTTAVDGGTGQNLTRITEQQYLDVLASTPLAHPGFHAWGDVETSGMTAAQLSRDNRLCISWHQQRGIDRGLYFRAAYWQNLAAAGNDDGARSMLLGAATYNGLAGVDVWPPVNRFNIARKGIHADGTTAMIDSHMATLESTRGLWLPYTHGVQTTPTQYEASTAVWTYLADAIAQGVTDGWLQAVTLDDLFLQSGGRFRPGFGGTQVAEYVDVDGDLVTQVLP